MMMKNDKNDTDSKNDKDDKDVKDNKDNKNNKAVYYNINKNKFLVHLCRSRN